MAEIVGFEPTVEHLPYDGLANRCLKPLSHISSVSIFVAYLVRG